MATPFPFTIGQTLTAAQLNAVTTLATTTKTASHTLVIADQGTRVIMNSASATTITVNTSIFGASDVVEIQNIGAGVCTVTAGTTTVSSAGPLAIPQHGGGRLVFSSASAATYFPTAVTAAASGLTCVKAETTFTSATTVNVDNVFSATHTNYLVISTFIGTTGDDLSLRLRVGGVDNSTASSYVRQGTQTNGTTLSGFRANSAQTKFGSFNTSGTSFAMFQFCNPFSATTTNIYGNFAEPGAASTIDSQYTLHNAASSFDGFSLLCLTTGNVTGSFTVYGYSKTV